MDKIFEREFENLRDLIKNPTRAMSKIKADHHRIISMLIEAEAMPEDELVRRAKQIKPLVRVDDKERKLDPGENEEYSMLVYVEPTDINQSYLFSFDPKKHIVRDKKRKPLKAEKLEEVARFICYHRYGGHCMFLRPGVDEVLQQFPKDVDINEISAFEIKFASDDIREIYNSTVDRHVSTVVLYKVAGGLPEEVRTQSVIVSGKTYSCE